MPPEDPKEPEWVGRQLAEIAHMISIREHGGHHGLRDESLLESALGKPKNLWAYTPGVDLARLASSYAYGITRNHPFQDGNKRTALLVMYTFLGLNGRKLKAPEPEAVKMFLLLAAGDLTEEALTEWVRGNI
ncbi:MAG: type II toxin-antitoxin system death-on-curing family toxin [Planctomycetota bacterium]